ncbi:uncharacterized protein N7469_002445 [Penicillium citrinum]|uniref:Uncharacterized protein n=1 Tax=Penicillium citrinum TaxID=5077 RepID=A0A9W9PAH0_PENCI|nr:uncharacterized protein N7469_002445 [Penicillium citrinum]KAJ5240854.1 hypothetical protein N7469_002445 [Penicillium citrinum]
MVCEYGPKRLRFRQSRYTTSSSASADKTRRESNALREPTATSNDPGAISATSETPHAAPTDHLDYRSHHPNSIDGSGSARILTRDHPPCDGSGYPANGSSVSAEPLHRRANADITYVSPGNNISSPNLSPPHTLTDEVDCKVFAFYVESAGHWIDIGSPEGYFHSYVPQLALREPLLLAACLSCASHLMYLRGLIDKEAEQYYSDRVVSLMIPALSSDQANSSNEVLLATIVILRMSEQFLELSSDAQRHLQGAASVFLDGTDWSPVETNLATSCFWTYLRESIRISFLREQPCPFDLGHLTLREDDMMIPAATDGIWTHRMTFLIIRAGELCWASPRQYAVTEARRLKTLLEKWRAHLPPSFRPWCICENDNNPFPNIRYFAPWHVVAWQFYYAAIVMLAVYYPEDWADTNLYDMHRYIETAIVAPTRLLCGLCMSNMANVGTNLNGSHLMAWCGRFLSGREEQQCLLNFLTEFSRNTKWPSQVDCARLEETWAKSRRPWLDCLGVSPGV